MAKVIINNKFKDPLKEQHCTIGDKRYSFMIYLVK